MIKMLKNFNKLVKSVIFESIENDDDEKRIREVYHCNEFFHRYIEPLVDSINEKDDGSKLIVAKQRQNVFLVTGIFNDVSKFFNEFKIDEGFMENPQDFRIFSPQYMLLDYADDIHYMGRGEMWPKQDFDVPGTHDVDNSKNVRSTVYGRWFSFYEDDSKGYKLKGIKPKDLLKNLKKMKKELPIDEVTIISIEFSVNCEQWKNQIFDEMSEYSDVEYRDDVNRNDDDFDYSLAALPKHSKEDEDEAKKSLKDIKRTSKKFKENKI